MKHESIDLLVEKMNVKNIGNCEGFNILSHTVIHLVLFFS